MSFRIKCDNVFGDAFLIIFGSKQNFGGIFNHQSIQTSSDIPITFQL